MTIGPLSEDLLPEGIRSRFVDNGNGLSMHILEAGNDDGVRPFVLLLHGFPELAYSWRKIMLPLADAGYYVVAPDQRGYGRTTGWKANYEDDPAPFRFLNLVRDTLGLVAALGRREVSALIGHDFGSPLAAWCTLIRPDIFQRVVLMSAPFGGPPARPFGAGFGKPVVKDDIHDALANLEVPRKHYQWYYSGPEANDDMQHCPEGVHAFLRAYYHHKSADWPANKPFELDGWTARDLALMPRYYIMDLDKTMAETVASEMPSADAIAACTWLPDSELSVYAGEFERTGFQGGLQWYRCATGPAFGPELAIFSGMSIHVPAAFIAGASDWGVYQKPGDYQAMQKTACTDMRQCDLIEGAGHWVQQEQPDQVVSLLARFLDAT